LVIDVMLYGFQIFILYFRMKPTVNSIHPL
jgi:hypothetical protein